MSDILSLRLTTPRLLFWLGIKAFVMLLVILYAGIGLGPDEAQYWTWSRTLDWGYYSKPPGIAWQIWLGTQAFGQTEGGVRSVSILLAFLQAFTVYQLALKADLQPRAAFWCGLFMAFCPIGILGSLFAITDGGLLLCWTGACLTVISALQKKQAPHPLLVGGWILLGALFKWPMYLFWAFFMLCRHWYFPNQKLSVVAYGCLFSLAGLLPSLWWNASHGWATFRHVSSTLQGGHGHTGGNFFSFVGSQVGLVSPVLFVLLLIGLWQWMKQKRQLSPPLFFCGFVTLALLGMASFMAYFQKVQGNWIIFAYPTGFVILGWNIFEQHLNQVKWAKLGLGLSVALTGLMFLFPSFYTSPRLSSYALAYRLNPFKHNLGWKTLHQVLSAQGYDPHQHFLLSDKYQTTSLLSFYGEGQKRAYFLNLQGMRKNQFSYWPSLQEEQQGKTGFFVWTENSPYLERDWQVKRDFYQQELKKYFEKVDFLGSFPLISKGATAVKAVLIFRCEACKQIKLSDSSLY